MTGTLEWFVVRLISLIELLLVCKSNSIFFLMMMIIFSGNFGNLGEFIFYVLVQAQHVAELIQRAQQLVANVQQVGAQRCGHALQVLLVILYAKLQSGQRVVCVQWHVRQGGTRVLGTQQLLHKAVHLLRQRFVQVVGGFVLRIAVRAPMIQLYCVQHFRHCGHYAVWTVSAVRSHTTTAFPDTAFSDTAFPATAFPATAFSATH